MMKNGSRSNGMSVRVLVPIGCIILLVIISLQLESDLMKSFIDVIGINQQEVLPLGRRQQRTFASDTSIYNYFDQAANDAYSLVLTDVDKEEKQQPNKNDNDSEKSFDINQWKRTTRGGLLNDDRQMIAYYYSKANSVFEYGLGESTYIADHMNVQRYAGVDSDINWIAKTQQSIVDYNNNKNTTTNKNHNNNKNSFRFYYADIGSTKLWGYPTNDNYTKIQYQYQIAPLYSELYPFDVYMVDGRYRTACVLLSFLHHSSTTTKLLSNNQQKNQQNQQEKHFNHLERARQQLYKIDQSLHPEMDPKSIIPNNIGVEVDKDVATETNVVDDSKANGYVVERVDESGVSQDKIGKESAQDEVKEENEEEGEVESVQEGEDYDINNNSKRRQLRQQQQQRQQEKQQKRLLLSSLSSQLFVNSPIVLLHDCWRKEYSYDKIKNPKSNTIRSEYYILDKLFILTNHSSSLLCAYTRPTSLSDETIYQTWLQYRTIVV